MKRINIKTHPRVGESQVDVEERLKEVSDLLMPVYEKLPDGIFLDVSLDFDTTITTTKN